MDEDKVAAKKPRKPRAKKAAPTTPAKIEPGRLYSEAEWSLYTRKDRRTWTALRAEGKIKFIRFGRSIRYRGEDLLEYLENARAS